MQMNVIRRWRRQYLNSNDGLITTNYFTNILKSNHHFKQKGTVIKLFVKK